MTTLAPVLDLVGDVGGFSLFRYAGALWVAYLRDSGELEIHRSDAGVLSFTSLEVPSMSAPKEQIAAIALGDELCLTWRHRDNGALYFAKWSFISRLVTQAPTSLWVGRSPSLKVYTTVNLVMAYRDDLDRHVYRTSRNAGLTWSADPIIVDSAAVLEVDLDVYPESSNTAYWDERA